MDKKTSSQASAPSPEKKRSFLSKLNPFRFKIRRNERDADKPKKEKPPKKEKKPKVKRAKPAKKAASKPKKQPKTKKEGGGRPPLVLVILFGVIGMVGVVYGSVVLISENTNVQKLLVRAGVHYAEESYESALQVYDKVLQRAEGHVLGYLGKADTYVALEQLDEAIATLETGIEVTEDPRLEERLKELLAPEEEELDPEAAIQWSDPEFEKMIRMALGFADSRAIRASDLETISTIKIVGGSHAVVDEDILSRNTPEGYYIDNVLYETRGGIRSLEDLAYFPNLRKLTVIYNHVQNLAGIETLDRLDTLSLGFNDIDDIAALAGLENLQSLFLFNNYIRDLTPLSGLKNLEILWLYNNQISDLSPLRDLAELRGLYINNNQVSNLAPLAGLPELTFLYANNNNISDITVLAGVQSLSDVTLEGNPVTDFSPIDHVQNVNQPFNSSDRAYW